MINKEKPTFCEINRMAENPAEFLAFCTESYRNRVCSVAKEIFENKSKNIIMLAGPSSSGKTTTASILSKCIEDFGGRAYIVSLDDFYFPRSVGYPLDENGKPDYECVEALDIELIHRCFGELQRFGKSSFPVFDFPSGERIENSKNISLEENDVIIVEGLHALNPVITDTLDESRLFRIYVSVSTRVYGDEGEVLFSKRDLRLIRRTVRDYQFRSTSVERTFEIWESVMRGEDKYLFPYESLADVKINSFHPCEPCVFTQKATALLTEAVNGEYGEKAKSLINKLSLFKSTDISILPADSLLREFVGQL